MEYEQFVEKVQREAGLRSADQAERIIGSVFVTLGERLGKGERDLLADQLPKKLKVYLGDETSPPTFDLEEFYNRVQTRADVGHPEAIRQARCVVSVLSWVIGENQLHRIFSGLQGDFDELLSGPKSSLSPTMDSSEFGSEAGLAE